MPQNSPRGILFVLLLSACTAGCAGMNHAERGALLGSGVGAATGAIIGSHSGHGEGGALLGAATGAIVGGLAGEAEDAREERDAAMAYASHQQHRQQAITNADVVNMTQNSVGDEVIMGAIRTRGGRFHLSPDAIIGLKQQGVSDPVLQFMQDTANAPGPSQVAVVRPRTVIAPTIEVVPPPPPHVIVRPRRRAFIGRPRRFHGHFWW